MSRKRSENRESGAGAVSNGLIRDKFTYHCKKQFRHNGENISSITIRRATVSDAIAAESFSDQPGFHAKNVHYYSMLSGHSPDALKKMDLYDWLKFMKGAGDFLGMGGLTAGD